jgi:hypothetical protein
MFPLFVAAVRRCATRGAAASILVEFSLFPSKDQAPLFNHQLVKRQACFICAEGEG